TTRFRLRGGVGGRGGAGGVGGAGATLTPLSPRQTRGVRSPGRRVLASPQARPTWDWVRFRARDRSAPRMSVRFSSAPSKSAPAKEPPVSRAPFRVAPEKSEERKSPLLRLDMLMSAPEK